MLDKVLLVRFAGLFLLGGFVGWGVCLVGFVGWGACLVGFAGWHFADCV